jgi:DNA-binding HxlR family transcriptional regulator
MPKRVNRLSVHPRFLYDFESCGIKRALDVLGEKWTLLILREAIYGLRRFDDLARALKCGRGVLSSRLKTLVRAGILAKQDYAEPGHRGRAEYRLTAKGRDLYPALLALSQWSDRWDPPKAGPAALVTDRETRRAVSVVITSRADIRGLTIDDLSIRPGPGSKLLRHS